MGYNARNDEIRDNVTRMRRAREISTAKFMTPEKKSAVLEGS